LNISLDVAFLLDADDEQILILPEVTCIPALRNSLLSEAES